MRPDLIVIGSVISQNATQLFVDGWHIALAFGVRRFVVVIFPQAAITGVLPIDIPAISTL